MDAKLAFFFFNTKKFCKKNLNIFREYCSHLFIYGRGYGAAPYGLSVAPRATPATPYGPSVAP